jgi:hypothetical protein
VFFVLGRGGEGRTRAKKPMGALDDADGADRRGAEFDAAGRRRRGAMSRERKDWGMVRDQGEVIGRKILN